MTSCHRNFSECYDMILDVYFVKPIDMKAFVNISFDYYDLVSGCSDSMLYLIANNANPYSRLSLVSKAF
jgi:hypothetical protein